MNIQFPCTNEISHLKIYSRYFCSKTWRQKDIKTESSPVSNYASLYSSLFSQHWHWKYIKKLLHSSQPDNAGTVHHLHLCTHPNSIIRAGEHTPPQHGKQRNQPFMCQNPPETNIFCLSDKSSSNVTIYA